MGFRVVSYRNSTSNHNSVSRTQSKQLVVSYRNSTSNHNRYIRPLKRGLLYLIEILHQTTTGYSSGRRPFCCILSKFYIKPQLSASHCLQVWGCILSKFYIKPQQCLGRNREDMGCILSKFYIKPQLLYELILEMNVVSYRNSTSNHNLQPILYSLDKVVSYRNSTSNHNGDADLHHSGRVVSYRNSTSNHNLAGRGAERQALYLIEILHQTTTERPVIRIY